MLARPLLIVVLMLFVALGCGENTTSAKDNPSLRSVSEVKRAFSQQGIRLAALPPSPIPSAFVQLLGERGGISVTVQIYRRIPRDVVVSSVGNGKPRTLRARNVVVYWTGRDLPAVRAAVAKLR